MFKNNNFLSLPLFVLIFTFVLYIVTSPFTVQSGDTGELVANSYFLRVSHPPGYPLWTLLYHLPVRYFNLGNPFQAASVVTILISMVWIGLLVWRFNNKNEVLIVSVLATSLLVWRYSILPDVFALHVLFLILVFLAFENPALLDRKLFIFLISLSVANHHTIALVFPLFLYSIFQNPTKKKISTSIICGLFSLSLYFLLFLFHPEDYGSWNNIKSLNHLIAHFLRKEYGTFSLTAESFGNSSWITFFVSTFLKDSWSVLLTTVYIIFSHWVFIKRDKKIILFVLCLLGYFLIFTSFGGMRLEKDAESVFERFLIHPTILLFCLVLYLHKSFKVELPRWLVTLLLINFGLNVLQNFTNNNYKKNTYIEDHLLNVLNILPEKSVYFASGDTYGFGTYYLKDVKNIRPDIILIQTTWGNDWFQKKFRKRFPDILIKDDPFFTDNFDFDNYRLFTNFSPKLLGSGYAKSFYGLVFEISKISDPQKINLIRCDFDYEWRNRPSLEDYSSYEVGLVYDLKYGDCDHASAAIHLLSNNIGLAKIKILQALKLSPNNTSYQENLCKIYKLTKDPLLEECKNKLIEMYSLMHPKYSEFY